MCSKKYIYLLFTLILFFIFPQKIEAAFSYSIDSITSSIITDKEQIISATLTILDLPGGDSYFRVGINEGSGYTGYNKVGETWIKMSSLSEDESSKTCSKYLKISSDGTYSIDFKIGSDVDIANGDHILKAHRFRSTCTIDSLKPEIAVTILLPTPTPSPTPTQQPTNPPTQVPTQAPTTSPTKSPSPVPTKSPSPKPTPTESPTQEPTETPFDILIDNNSTQKPEQVEAKVLGDSTTKKKLPLISYLFISLGFGFLGYVGYMLYNMKNAKVKEDS